MATGVVFSEAFKRHDTGAGHPESPARMDAVARALATDSISSKLLALTPRPAERGEILLVHWDRLYQEVVQTSGRPRVHLDPDTVASADSSEIAHLSAGATLVAIEAVMEGRVPNAFALARPPGHHAKPDKAMGFCLFNNVAVGARFAQKRYRIQRVLVVDFDVHHGNGTQKAFYTSPEVLYASTHQWPHYPGTGSLEETGKDEGEGFTLNVPMPAGMGNEEMIAVFREILLPVSREFAPELVLVSAGFDGHRDDPLAGMMLTREGYAALTHEILELARASCDGRAVFVLEGGYHLGALEQSLVSVLGVMSGGKAPSMDASGAADELLREVRDVHAKYWSCLKR